MRLNGSQMLLGDFTPHNIKVNAEGCCALAQSNPWKRDISACEGNPRSDGMVLWITWLPWPHPDSIQQNAFTGKLDWYKSPVFTLLLPYELRCRNLNNAMVHWEKKAHILKAVQIIYDSKCSLISVISQVVLVIFFPHLLLCQCFPLKEHLKNHWYVVA